MGALAFDQQFLFSLAPGDGRYLGGLAIVQLTAAAHNSLGLKKFFGPKPHGLNFWKLFGRGFDLKPENADAARAAAGAIILVAEC